MSSIVTIIISWKSKVDFMWCISFFTSSVLIHANVILKIRFAISNHQLATGGSHKGHQYSRTIFLRLIDIFKEGKFYSTSMRVHECEGIQARLIR